MGKIQFVNHIFIWPSGLEVNYQFLEEVYKNDKISGYCLMSGYPDEYARRGRFTFSL